MLQKLFIMLALIPMISLLQAAEKPSSGPDTITFKSDIKPIFDRHCIECHEGWFPDAGLRLDTLENVRKGGRTGPAVVPGKPDKGLIMLLSMPGKNRPARMPPGAKKLSDTEIEQLREWIRQGVQ